MEPCPVSDLAGRPRPVSLAKHNGRYVVSVVNGDPDHQSVNDTGLTTSNDDATSRNVTAGERARRFDELAASGQFTDTELRTIRALAFERLTVIQLAQVDRCSRQAVLARVYGNSRGQGGLLQRAARFWSPTSNRP